MHFAGKAQTCHGDERLHLVGHQRVEANELVKHLDRHQGCIFHEAVGLLELHDPLENFLPIFPLDELLVLNYIFGQVYLNIVTKGLFTIFLARL
jgi:hypothetical protein